MVVCSSLDSWFLAQVTPFGGCTWPGDLRFNVAFGGAGERQRQESTASKRWLLKTNVSSRRRGSNKFRRPWLYSAFFVGLSFDSSTTYKVLSTFFLQISYMSMQRLTKPRLHGFFLAFPLKKNMGVLLHSTACALLGPPSGPAIFASFQRIQHRGRCEHVSKNAIKNHWFYRMIIDCI